MSENESSPEQAPVAAAEEKPPTKSEGVADSAPLRPSEEGDLPELEVAIAALQREKKETYDRLLRTAADFDNYKKRSKRDAAEAEDRGRTRLLKALLPVVDNLERAVALDQADASDIKGMSEGIRLVLKMFQAVLEEFQVLGFESRHQMFDPQVHEAVSQIESDDVPPGTIVEEFQRGYHVGKKLLRPAMVVVARAKVASSESKAETPGAGGNGTQGLPGSGVLGLSDAQEKTGEP